MLTNGLRLADQHLVISVSKVTSRLHKLSLFASLVPVSDATETLPSLDRCEVARQLPRCVISLYQPFLCIQDYHLSLKSHF